MFKILFFLVLALWFLVSLGYTQEELTETITITTYYPAPFGVYNQLQINRLAVGDTDGDGQLDEDDRPDRDGHIRLRPEPDDPANWVFFGQEGQIAYSDDNDMLFIRNETAWMPAVPAGVPNGAIIMYSGPWNFTDTGLGTGPLAGWALCNGQNGTPDLRDRFVMGTGVEDGLDTTGGANNFTLTIAQLPPHTHPISTQESHNHRFNLCTGVGSIYCMAGRACCDYPAFSAFTLPDGAHNHGGRTGSIGSGTAIDNRPAFIQLAYIMRL